MKPLAIRIVTVSLSVAAVSSLFTSVAVAGMRLNRCETIVRDERKK